MFKKTDRGRGEEWDQVLKNTDIEMQIKGKRIQGQN